jgi:hypothetical protein
MVPRTEATRYATGRLSRFRFVTATALAIGLALAATQCSLLTSVDGLVGGAAAPDAADADSSVTDAPLADADAAALDGSVEAAADGGRYCASSTSAFCEDFDDEGPFVKWTSSEIGAGGSVARDRAASLSAPNSLLTTSAASPSSIPAYLRLTTPAVVHRVRVAYDLRVDARDPQTAYTEAGYIRFGVGNSSHVFYMRLYGGTSQGSSFTAEAYLQDGGIAQNNVDLAGNPQFTSWTRVAIDYDLRAAPHLSVSINGVPSGDTPLDATNFKADVAHIELGIGYTGHPTSAAWKLRYENVTIDTDP